MRREAADLRKDKKMAIEMKYKKATKLLKEGNAITGNKVAVVNGKLAASTNYNNPVDEYMDRLVNLGMTPEENLLFFSLAESDTIWDEVVMVIPPENFDLDLIKAWTDDQLGETNDNVHEEMIKKATELFGE